MDTVARIVGFIAVIGFLLFLRKQFLLSKLRKTKAFYLNDIAFKFIRSWTRKNEEETHYTGKEYKVKDPDTGIWALEKETNTTYFKPRYGLYLYVKFYVLNTKSETKELPTQVTITNDQHSFPLIDWRVSYEEGGALPNSQGRYSKKTLFPDKAKEVIAMFDVSPEIFKTQNQYRIRLSDGVTTYSSDFTNGNLSNYITHYLKF